MSIRGIRAVEAAFAWLWLRVWLELIHEEFAVVSTIGSHISCGYTVVALRYLLFYSIVTLTAVLSVTPSTKADTNLRDLAMNSIFCQDFICIDQQDSILVHNRHPR